VLAAGPQGQLRKVMYTLQLENALKMLKIAEKLLLKKNWKMAKQYC
jgi:hypothetical protein